MVPLLSSKYFDYVFYFFKWNQAHSTDDYILSGDHLMLQSKLKAVSTSL